MNVHSQNQAGFSYIDVMAAIIILSIGIIAMSQAIMFSLIRSRESEQQLYSKQIAQSTLESIFAARDIKRTGGLDGWGSVGNIGTNPDATGTIYQGIFVVGWHPIREEAGYDGVVGTEDDSCQGAGACSSGGNPANTSAVLPGYQRSIVIEDMQDADLPTPPHPIKRRRITIIVRYAVGGVTREEEIRTIISSFESI